MRSFQILPELNSRYKATITYSREYKKGAYSGVQAILWQLNLNVVVSPESIDVFRGEREFDYLEKNLATTGLVNLSWNEAVSSQSERRLPIADVVKFYNFPGPDRSQRAVVDVHANREATSSEDDDEEELKDTAMADSHSAVDMRESRSVRSRTLGAQRLRASLEANTMHLAAGSRPCRSIETRRSSTIAAATSSSIFAPQARERNTAKPCCAHDETSTDDDYDGEIDDGNGGNNFSEGAYSQIWHRVNCSCCPANREDTSQPHGRPRRPRSVSRPRDIPRRSTDCLVRENCCDFGEHERAAHQSSVRRRSHSVGMCEEGPCCDSRRRTSARACCGSSSIPTESIVPTCGGGAMMMPSEAVSMAATAAPGAICYNGAFYAPWQYQPHFYGLVSGRPACAATSVPFVLQKPLNACPNAVGADDPAACCCQMSENAHRAKRY